MLSSSTLSPELADLFTNGIPASIDGDGTERRMLAGLLDSIDFDLSARFGKRAQLYRTWLALPKVTLPQAAWLLAGRDPFAPDSTEPEAPPADLQRQYLSIINRLECEVVSGTLKPIGKAVSGFERRFHLIAVAHAALRADIAESFASHVIMLSQDAKQAEPPPLAWQTERVLKRMEIHRKLIEIIQTKDPNAVEALAPKSRRTQIRRAQTAPTNLKLNMRALEYDIAFREKFKKEFGGDAGYHITALMLRQDRDQLNIKFKPGRPKSPA